MLKQAPIDPALHVRQPATIEEVIGGRKYTGYVSVTYGEATVKPNRGLRWAMILRPR
jgi:hypothetical protein